MKKLLLLTKTLLAVALLCVGQNAWGEATPLYERGTTNAWAAADLTDWPASVSNENFEYKIDGGLYLGNKAPGTWKSSFKATKTLTPTKDYVVSMTTTISMGMAANRASSYDYIKLGGVEFRVYGTGGASSVPISQVYVDGTAKGEAVSAVRGGSYIFNVEINQITGKVKYSVSGSSTITEANATTEVAIENVEVGHSRGGSEGGSGHHIILSKINVSEEESSETYADYTVKYVSTISAVETEIKSNVSRKGAVDATVTLDASDKNTITYGGHQYYYVSDNASSSTIANDNSTVVKVVFAQATFDNGNYYFKNKSNGAYFAAGNNWGTHAVSNMQGHVTALTVQPGGKYHIDTHISNGGDSHYLNGEYTDGAAQEWAIASDGAGYYTINNGSGNLTAGAVGENLTVGASTGDNAKWTILTAAEWKADQETRLASATAASGEDATFYIAAPNFPRNDNTENAKWQGGPTIAGYEGVSGNGINYNGQKFTNPYATFDVYQALTGVKPGAYKLTVQGFYRNGLNNVSDANDNLAKLYANSSEVALKNIRYYGYTDDSHSAEGFTTDKSGVFVPNSQSDAGIAFNAGKFENELYVVVGEDGNLRVGVKKDAATGPNQDWAVFDNFKLTYYGNSVSVTIGANKFTTFASPYPLDLTSATQTANGFTAYRASAVNDETVTFKDDVNQNVQANTGVLLKGTANAVVSIPVVASGTELADNALLVNASGNTFAAAVNTTYYGMNKDSDPLKFGTFDPSTVAIPANKAYLTVATGGGARAIVGVFGDITGVENVEAAPVEAKAKEGKFIENGKLVIVKNGQKFNAAGAKLY